MEKPKPPEPRYENCFGLQMKRIIGSDGIERFEPKYKSKCKGFLGWFWGHEYRNKYNPVDMTFLCEICIRCGHIKE